MGNQSIWDGYKMGLEDEFDPILPSLFIPETIQEVEADFDQDLDYMKRLYPETAKEVVGFIEDECDQLEYDGSCMFHEYPDKVTIQQIADRIYGKVSYHDTLVQQSRGCRDRDCDDRGNQNQGFLRALVEVMLLNEMYNRRCRYHRRCQMFR